MRVEYLARTSLVGKRLPPLSLSFRPHDFQVWRAKSVNPLMICEDIWKIYRVGDVEVPALRGLSLTIEQGEFVAVMGSSGSGKSTLMNILGCLDQPTRGQYRMNGVEVGRLRPDRLAEIRNQQIGFVFHSPHQRLGKCPVAAVLPRTFSERAAGARIRRAPARRLDGARAAFPHATFRWPTATGGDRSGAGGVALLVAGR